MVKEGASWERKKRWRERERVRGRGGRRSVCRTGSFLPNSIAATRWSMVVGERRNHRSCVPVPRIFCQSKDFSTLFRVSIDSAYFGWKIFHRDRNYIFLEEVLSNFYRYQHSKFFKSIKNGDGKCLILLD